MPEPLSLARVMEETAYQVRQTLTNKEWLLNHGEDYSTILAEKKAAHERAKAAYLTAKKEQDTWLRGEARHA